MDWSELHVIKWNLSGYESFHNFQASKPIVWKFSGLPGEIVSVMKFNCLFD